jgi:hypothetical protein
MYVKISRTVNIITAEWSDNGTDWYNFNPDTGDPLTVTLSMDTDVYIGLIVCSHDSGALCTAVFSDVVWDVPVYNAAWNPSPLDGSTNMSTAGVTLSWLPGENATGHNVYLGTNPGALPLVATQPLGDEDYDTGPLEGGTWYYWSVTETNNPEWPGPTWSFKTERLGTGEILGQLWAGIEGVAVVDLTSNPDYPHNPSQSQLLTSFESPTNIADNYGARIVGYLLPETSGDYTFWVASDDASELWLSTTESPCDASLIAYVTGWTAPQEWDKEPSQQSAAIPLLGGEKYLIYALMKEGGGGDNLAAAWQGPDNPARSVIDGYYLAPGYVDYWASAPNPPVGATMVPLDAQTLSWKPGATVAQHHVYFGTDPGAMSLIATNPVGDEDVDITGLCSAGNTYYWQVNEVNGLDTIEGCLWDFSVEEWVCQDIGTYGGSSDYNDTTGVWTIDADGADIWGNSDQFRYCYQKMKMTRSTGEIVARMVDWSRPSPNLWAKAGVMVRESLAANSKYVDQMITGGNGGGESFQWRDSTGGGCGGSHTHSGVSPPEWVKLVRNGDQWTAFHAEDYDGVPGPWQQEGGVHTQSQPDTVYVGLAVTSHDTGFVAQAVLDNLSIWTPDPDQAWGPSPSDNATGVPIEGTVMTWNPGDAAAQHKLYMGTDPDALALMDTLALGNESYDPGMLDLATTYYWSVTEVNGPYEVEGMVWAFTTQEYLSIDDFEAYDDSPVPLEDPPAQVEIEPPCTIEPVAPPEQEYVPGAVTVVAEDPGVGCLIAEWAFEGNYDDTSGSGFHGTPVNDVAIVVDPCRGNVLSLDGDGDWVNCGNPAALNFGTGDWTLSAWVKNTMTGTGDDNKGSIIANGGDTGGGHRYCLIVSEQDEGKINLVIDDDNVKYNKKQITAATPANDDVWHHVLGVRQGDTITIYMDGEPEASTNIGGADYDLSGTSQADVLIGAITDHPEGTKYKDYAGLIDDVQIYNCALTEGNARYLAGVGNKYEPGYYHPLLVYYSFDANDATDGSGNAYDGTEVAGDSGLPTYEPGISGQAMRLNGNGDHVIDDDGEDYLNGLSELSVSLWIKSDQDNTDKGFIIFHDPAGNDQMNIRYDKAGSASKNLQRVIGYGITSTDGDQQSQSTDWVQTKNWQHVCMTWKSGVGLKLYLDGVLDETGWLGNIRGGVISGMDRFIVGRGGKDGGTSKSWDGMVDEVRIYDCALSYGEIRYLAGQGPLALPGVYGPMIAEYTFDTDASDTSGNELHGSFVGDAKVEDGMVKLDGSGDAVDLGQSVRFNPLTGPFSISAWVRQEGHTTGSWGDAIISNRGENQRGWQLRRLSNTQRLSFTTRNCGDQDGWGAGGQDWPLNEWHHVAAVRDGTQKWLHIDGGPKDAVSGICDTVEWAGHNVYLGGRANNNNDGFDNAWFRGQLDDVRIYECALTHGQVMTLSGYVETNKLEDTWTAMGDADISLGFGSQWMDMAYDNSEWMYQGQARRDAPFADWTKGGAKALTLWFRGNPGNAGELAAMYVTLRDHPLTPDGRHAATVAYDGDREDLNVDEWQEWNIDLTEFGDVNLPGMGDIAVGVIGLGDAGNPGGLLSFDDIRLYPSRCVPMYGPLADLTDDCVVDVMDLRVLVGDWLMGDETGTGLVARYEFDGNYDDSSGKGHHGTPVGALGFETDPVRGQVLDLPGGSNQYVNIGGVGISGTMPRTICCWAKADNTSIPDWTLVFGFTTPGGGCGSHFNIGSLGGPGGVGAHAWCWEETIFTDDQALEWRHYAMSYDGTAIKYYGDGVPMDTDPGKSNVINLVHADNVHVGSRATQDSSFPGNVDDARIYKRVLTDAEVATVMGGGDPASVYFPLDSVANIYEDEPINSKEVNFKDYAAMMEEWLTQKWWP